MKDIVREFGTREMTNDPSKTAELIAMRRTSESMRPENERICYDPYAFRFINPAILQAAKEHPDEAKKKAAEVEKYFPGLGGSILARVRYFDDFISSVAGEGIHQMVILGAGYDTRAYRIEGLKKGVRVFEVDHPYTQRIKIEKIREIFGSLPDYVLYVPTDLSQDNLADVLRRSGYESTEKTLFVLEGLTMYLPPVVVDMIFRFIIRHSGSGSIVIFDYYPESLIDGTDQREIARNIREFSKKTGEPLQFGVPDGEIIGFLEDRGFSRIRNISSADYRAMYLKGCNANRQTTDLISFAHAEVP